MGRLNIAIIFGGSSTEHEISLSSAMNIINNISGEKYNIIPVYITRRGEWLMYEGEARNIKDIQWEKFGTPCQISLNTGSKCLLRMSGQKVKYVPVDAAFPVLHGKNGEDGTIQGVFEIAGIPYVGSGVLASALAMDKAVCKIMAASAGIRQAKFLEFKNIKESQMEDIYKKVRYQIGYPCFVKPARAGSSIGISKVRDKVGLKSAFEAALEVDSKILVEKAVIGRELECAALGGGNEPVLISGIGEILAGDEFYSYNAKYNNAGSKVVIPADIPNEKKDEIRNCATKLFDLINCKGLARIDFFLESGTGNVIFNEINTMPGFTDISMYPMLTEDMGIDMCGLIDRFIEIALGE